MHYWWIDICRTCVPAATWPQMRRNGLHYTSSVWINVECNFAGNFPGENRLLIFQSILLQNLRSTVWWVHFSLNVIAPQFRNLLSSLRWSNLPGPKSLKNFHYSILIFILSLKTLLVWLQYLSKPIGETWLSICHFNAREKWGTLSDGRKV